MATISENDSSPNLRRAEVLSKLDVSEHELDLYDNAHKMKGVQDIQCSSDNLRSERFSLPNLECHNQLPDMANVVIPPPMLFLNSPPPTVEIQIESGTGSVQAAGSENSLKFTEEQETFFDELMSSSSTLSEMFHRGIDSDDELEQSHGTRIEDRCDRLPSPLSLSHRSTNNGNASLHQDTVGDDNVTPQASPRASPNLSIRRWSVKRNTSPRHIDEDRLPTPTASPFVRRPLSSSSSCTSSPSIDTMSSTTIDPPTPFRYVSPEPYIDQTSSETFSTMALPKGKSSVLRRHSFSSDRKRNPVHHRQESRSMETSPQSTPIVKRSDRVTSASLIVAEVQGDSNTTIQTPHISAAQLEPSMSDIPTINIESASETDLTPMQNQNSIILPPPIEFMDKENRLIHDNFPLHSPTSPTKSLDTCVVDEEDRSNHNQLFDTTKELETDQITVVTPYESNPDEVVSFTEALASLDDYASTTGKTTKSSKSTVKLRSRSPEAKRRKEKKKKRSKTVANIDADTMNQVKEELARRSHDKVSLPEQKSDSKVQKLAREYSRKIKDHQRSRIFRRFSTVVEEPLSNVSSTGISEPEWLQDLREQKKSNTPPEASSSSLAELQSAEHNPQSISLETAALTGSLKRTKSRVRDHSDFDEDHQRKSGFKGWVRSLVDKISTSGYVKEK